MKLSFWIVLIQLFYLNRPWAQPLSTDQDKKNSQEAISETQNQMKDPLKREQLIQSHEAKKADRAATSVVGSENIDEIYAISADILPLIIQKNDDTQNSENALEKAQRNPAQFLQELPPEIQNRIQSLSQTVEQKKIQSNKSQVP